MRRHQAITGYGLAARKYLDHTTYRKDDNTNRPLRKKGNNYTIWKTIQDEPKKTEDTEIKIQLKPGHLPIKQKDRPIPYHLQNYVEKEINNLIKSGHLEKTQKVEKGGFVSPAVINVKKDKSDEIALDSTKLNDSCTKKWPRMPNMEKILHQKSTETRRAPKNPLTISKIDLKNAYGQLKLSEETSKHCNFAITGRNMNSFCRFEKGFYGLFHIPTIFQEKIDRTLKYQTPVWLDDIIIVTRWAKNKHREKLIRKLEKLQEVEYRASEKKSQLFLRETRWLGQETTEYRIKLNKKKIKVLLQPKPTTSCKELKIFLGAIHYLAKIISKLSEKLTEGDRYSKKENEMELEWKRRGRFQRDKEKHIGNTGSGTFCGRPR